MTSLPNELNTPGVSYGWVSLTQVVERLIRALLEIQVLLFPFIVYHLDR